MKLDNVTYTMIIKLISTGQPHSPSIHLQLVGFRNNCQGYSLYSDFSVFFNIMLWLYMVN